MGAAMMDRDVTRIKTVSSAPSVYLSPIRLINKKATPVFRTTLAAPFNSSIPTLEKYYYLFLTTIERPDTVWQLPEMWAHYLCGE